MFKALLSYDGTRYFGWQKTKAGPTIQEELAKALFQITREKVHPEAASRTDRGVHAEGQVIQFTLKQPLAPQKLLKALNACLPKDIRVLNISLEEFHPTLDAILKEYHYRICQGEVQDPTLRLYSWHLRYPLDREKIERAIPHLIGAHDFTAFANAPEKNPICTIESILFDGKLFRIRGNRFLYKMVRNLVGTLVYIGCGKLSEKTLPSLLLSKDRKQAGMTAPAHGLYLHQVFYPAKIIL